jgi:aldehyde dehydrogenase (NAD+)
MHLANSKLPFGGVGFSGMGNYHGEAGFKAFTHYKSIIDKPTWYESNVKYAPYSTKKLNLLKKLTK